MYIFNIIVKNKLIIILVLRVYLIIKIVTNVSNVLIWSLTIWYWIEIVLVIKWRMNNTIKTKSKFQIKRSNPMAWELEKEIQPRVPN